jgi:hypothetical protein
VTGQPLPPSRAKYLGDGRPEPSGLNLYDYGYEPGDEIDIAIARVHGPDPPLGDPGASPPSIRGT